MSACAVAGPERSDKHISTVLRQLDLLPRLQSRLGPARPPGVGSLSGSNRSETLPVNFSSQFILVPGAILQDGLIPFTVRGPVMERCGSTGDPRRELLHPQRLAAKRECSFGAGERHIAPGAGRL